MDDRTILTLLSAIGIGGVVLVIRRLQRHSESALFEELQEAGGQADHFHL